jgi:hypothetical protein
MTLEADVALLISQLLSCFGLGLISGILLRVFVRATGYIR